MKTPLSFIALVLLTVALLGTKVFATADLPNTSVWFTPSTAAVGDAISLNALVYNSQSVDATVTVAFTIPSESATNKTATTKINSVTEIIPAQTAKTVSIAWKMPVKTTVVTAAVTSAVNSKKASIPSLVGTIGTVSVGDATIPMPVTNINFPGSAQLSAWFGPALSKVEAFRTKEATHFATLRDSERISLGLTNTVTAITSDASATQALGNPGQYITFLFATSCATLFGSMALFYIAAILLILLILRFIVNIIF